MSTRICYTAPPSEPKSYGYTGSRVCCQRLKDLECRWPGNGPYCLQRSRGSPAAGKTEKRSCLAHSHSMCKPERTAAQAASPHSAPHRPATEALWPLATALGTRHDQVKPGYSAFQQRMQRPEQGRAKSCRGRSEFLSYWAAKPKGWPNSSTMDVLVSSSRNRNCRVYLFGMGIYYQIRKPRSPAGRPLRLASGS